MIIRKHEPSSPDDLEQRAQEYGPFECKLYSNAGGLTQFGAYVVNLEPGSRSSDRHWHEEEDEFMYVLSGEATVVENDGAHVLHSGDAACWSAGVSNAHHVINQSSSSCSFLIVGTRPTHDVCHYPDLNQVLHTEGDTWRIVSDTGEYLAGGKV